MAHFFAHVLRLVMIQLMKFGPIVMFDLVNISNGLDRDFLSLGFLEKLKKLTGPLWIQIHCSSASYFQPLHSTCIQWWGVGAKRHCLYLFTPFRGRNTLPNASSKYLYPLQRFRELEAKGSDAKQGLNLMLFIISTGVKFGTSPLVCRHVM